jgi:hypothetical protein
VIVICVQDQKTARETRPSAGALDSALSGASGAAVDFYFRPLQTCSLLDVPRVNIGAQATLRKAKLPDRLPGRVDSAEKLVGLFLSLGRDTAKMGRWLEAEGKLSAHDAAEVAGALRRKAARIVTL